MPYQIRKLPNKNLYEVRNELTGLKHSKGTTHNKALGQLHLLNAIDHGFKLKGFRK